jgi:hypothetical protein
MKHLLITLLMLTAGSLLAQETQTPGAPAKTPEAGATYASTLGSYASKAGGLLSEAGKYLTGAGAVAGQYLTHTAGQAYQAAPGWWEWLTGKAGEAKGKGTELAQAAQAGIAQYLKRGTTAPRTPEKTEQTPTILP